MEARDDEHYERICPNPGCNTGLLRRYQPRYGKDIFICPNCGNAEGVPGF